MDRLLHAIRRYSDTPLPAVGASGVLMGTGLSLLQVSVGVPWGWNTVLMGFIGPVTIWLGCRWLTRE